MSWHFTFKDDFQENRLFLNRLVISVVAMVVVALALVARLVYLQVVGHELYTHLSRDNQVKISPLPPPRG